MKASRGKALGSIATSFTCFWCSVFRCTLLIEKPDIAPVRSALLMVGMVGEGEGGGGMADFKEDSPVVGMACATCAACRGGVCPFTTWEGIMKRPSFFFYLLYR